MNSIKLEIPECVISSELYGRHISLEEEKAT